MVRSVNAAALALAYVTAFVDATNTPPPVPEDAQIGELAFPVTCEIFGFLQQTFSTVFTATAPVFGGTGQEVYYTDVVGHIDIPHYITGLAPLVGATQAQANVTVYLNLENASPSSLLVYQSTINGVQFSASEDGNIRIPPGSGTLPPLGPVTLGQANVAHRILLGQVTVDVQLQDSTGKNTFVPIPVTCGQQSIDFILGSIDVNSTSGLPPAEPSVGYVPDFPPTPQLFESGGFRFPYDCEFGPLGAETVDLLIVGEIPTYFSPGEEFYLTEVQSFLRVPEALVTLAQQAYPSVATFDTTVNTFNVYFSNSNPSEFNAAQTPIEASVQVVAGSDGLLIPIPANGNLPNVGPITAGAAGNIVSVAIGNANATTVLRDSSGAALLTLPITCNPPSPLELIGVPITNASPGNYSLGATVSPTATGGSGASSTGGLTLPTGF